jgi:hypothetical protein
MLKARRSRLTVAGTVLVAALSGVALTLPASATTRSQVTEVSCDGVTIKNGISVTHYGGNYSIKQNSTSPRSTTWVWATSQNHNDLPMRMAIDGETKTWSALAGTYTVKALRAAEQDCNGISFGHGNYTWNYTVTFNG